jgi:hypothetical protein
MMQKSLFLVCLLLLGLSLRSQQPLCVLKGNVSESQTQRPVVGAIIIVESADRKVTTDSIGSFFIDGLPVGRYTIRVVHPDFENAIQPEVLLSSGKETVLQIALTEKLNELGTLTIRARKKPNNAVNDMAGISSRVFTVEQTQRYAAAVNDPGRMVTSFAGVVGGDDGNNKILIRGNSPNGLLWRMEGVDIPNPNHFSNVATSGGGISILSAQLLANSDFMTGAFSPEYGNALSGVFDLHLRKGNTSKREYTFQAGFLGIDLATEGPLSKKHESSYLVNYRYSTLGMLGQLGVEVGPGITTFQDLSWNLMWKTPKAGVFTLFGFAGLSNQRVSPDKDSSKWEETWQRIGSRFESNTGATGITHTIRLKPHLNLKQVVSISTQRNGDKTTLLNENYTHETVFRLSNTVNRGVYSATLTHRINPRHTLRHGIIYTMLGNRSEQYQLDSNRILNQVLDAQFATATLQAFSQWRWRIGQRVTLNQGLHVLYLKLNNDAVVEPRTSLRWDVSRRLALSTGTGWHSQVLPPGIYMSLAYDSFGNRSLPNRNLPMPRARHHVFALDYLLGMQTRLKLEAYYQDLYKAGVDAGSATPFSMINLEEGYPSRRLSASGKGRNRGIEFTFERNFYKGFYALLTGSVYDSRYRGSDGVWRNTRWNGNHMAVLTAGREIVRQKPGKQLVWGLNVKTIYTGGLRQTPVDVAASRKLGFTVFNEPLSFSEKLPDYFRTDVKFSMRSNKSGLTRTLSLDLQNASSHRNEMGRYYDAQSDKVIIYHGMPLLPILAYKLEF